MSIHGKDLIFWCILEVVIALTIRLVAKPDLLGLLWTHLRQSELDERILLNAETFRNDGLGESEVEVTFPEDAALELRLVLNEDWVGLSSHLLPISGYVEGSHVQDSRLEVGSELGYSAVVALHENILYCQDFLQVFGVLLTRLLTLVVHRCDVARVGI